MGETLRSTLYWIFGCVFIFWAVELASLLVGRQLVTWGIFPRTIGGLIGIPLSPFIHASVSHVVLNTIPFVVLGGILALRGLTTFLKISFLIVLLGGLGVWIFGRSSYHVGASGLIFGYFGYLVARGWYDRKIGSIIIALVTLFLYGGILWGLLPTFYRVSWEGHLFGLLAGILGARLSANGVSDDEG